MTRRNHFAVTESEARDVLLLRAFELSPDATSHWTDDDRSWASSAAARAIGTGADGERFAAERARLAVDRLAVREPAIRIARTIGPWPRRAGWIVPGIAFAVGIAADAIGPSHQINVLAPPLLAIIAWNLLVYLWIVGRRLALPFLRQARTPIPVLSSWLRRFARQRFRYRQRHSGRRTETAARWPAQALTGFLTDWLQASAPLTGRRVARTLHLSALAMAAGMLAGLYVRGLALEYRAVWESTFLDADMVHRLLSVWLIPASLLTGIGLPDPIRLQEMRLPAGSGEPAAAWIHLHAVTLVLLVIVPRLLLAGYEHVRARRLARGFDLPLTASDPWYAAQLREYSGERTRMAIVPCHFTPTPAQTDRLQAALDLMSAGGWELVITPTVAYGAEENAAQALAPVPDPAAVFVWFSASATPETETHGVLLEHLGAGCPPGLDPIALVDESSFVARFGGADGSSQRRRTERRQAWRQLFAATIHSFAFIDADRDEAAAIATEIRPLIQRVNASSAASVTAPPGERARSDTAPPVSA